MSELTREQAQALIEEVLEVYPEKAKKDRAKHLMVNDKSIEQSKKCITSNRKSLPGVMTQRGCAYAGSKGVVWGPIKDIIDISHGPVGCGATPAGAAATTSQALRASIPSATSTSPRISRRRTLFSVATRSSPS